MKPPKFKRGETVFYLWSYNDIFSGTVYQIKQETGHEQKEEGVFYKTEIWVYWLSENGHELVESQLHPTLESAQKEKNKFEQERIDYLNSLKK